MTCKTLQTLVKFKISFFSFSFYLQKLNMSKTYEKTPKAAELKA